MVAKDPVQSFDTHNVRHMAICCVRVEKRLSIKPVLLLQISAISALVSAAAHRPIYSDPKVS